MQHGVQRTGLKNWSWGQNCNFSFYFSFPFSWGISVKFSNLKIFDDSLFIQLLARFQVILNHLLCVCTLFAGKLFLSETYPYRKGECEGRKFTINTRSVYKQHGIIICCCSCRFLFCFAFCWKDLFLEFEDCKRL